MVRRRKGELLSHPHIFSVPNQAALILQAMTPRKKTFTLWKGRREGGKEGEKEGRREGGKKMSKEGRKIW